MSTQSLTTSRCCLFGVGTAHKTTSKRKAKPNTSPPSTSTSASSAKGRKGIMSTLAALILGKHHDHVYHQVNHRHRLSYADLDALLDREEKELAVETERQRSLTHQLEDADARSTNATNTETQVFVDSHHKSSGGSSSGSEDEADWHGEGQHEEDLLLELEETTQESIHTISGAEDHLVKDIDHIVHVDVSDEQLQRMKSMMGVNCLHRGNIEQVAGKRWMVAVDGSEASKRAYEGVLKLMDPAHDHLLVVTIRDKNLPQRFALSPSEETQLRFELWKSARHIIKPYLDELPTRLAPNQYTVMVPDAWDARRMLCNLCKRYSIDTLCVGKHAKNEHNHHHFHLRSLHSYTQKHAHCHVIVF